jgi:choline dehydrogenase-like flavoprotein
MRHVQQDTPMLETDADRVFAQRVVDNQARLAAALSTQYDFIVCGAGTGGSVVARRLAENPDASVLLLEAGGTDDIPSVAYPSMWATNLGGPTDWAFQADPNKHLNNRSLMLSMGKVLGGGSSVNAMVWARGHKADWDFFAAEADSDAWSYARVVDIYRRVENWSGPADPEYRGSGGPVHIEPSPTHSLLGRAIVDAAAGVGIKRFDSPNGVMMEGPGGSSTSEVIIRNNRRQSIFRSYVYPYMDRPNLTVLTDAFVRRVLIEAKGAVGVSVDVHGRERQFRARGEVVLALGAIHTAKTLMLSGVGDQEQLARHAIPTVQHLPGVGRNLQDHLGFSTLWESKSMRCPTMSSDAVMFWSSTGESSAPDLYACCGPIPFASLENIIRYGAVPDSSWILHGAVTQPLSRGWLELTGSDPHDRIRIVDNGLSHDVDLTKAVACIEMLREVGNSAPLKHHAKREIMPGKLASSKLIRYIRDAGMSYWHQVGTAKMGRDPMAVVDANLQVYGVARLRVADGSIMPRLTTGNTMAPCVVIGERAADELKTAHGL